MISNNYLEKIYAGFLAKSIGVRLGAPVEPSFWTYDTIKNLYGDIQGYVKDFKNFAADDDTNGPIFFIRAINDYGKKKKITSEDIGNTWLNYTSEGHGMFWWGGYGISTEHTAYLNLKNGVKAPMSGSIRQNGETIAEQIGGQIFIDSWGLVCPGNVELASEYAEMAAKVSHDGDGMHGGKFIAGCIAKAFVTDDILEIIEAGLSVVPENSEFLRVNNAVMNFYNDNPSDFGACFKMLERDFGYDKYKGICHMIPNAGVVTLALLYGQGSISRSLEIATMCGWDTDCNAGNVGTIVGVAYGLEKIEEHYRKPINDMLVASSISGSLNIVDIPTFAKELAVIGYNLSNEEIPEYLNGSTNKRDLYFDFELPGSTHGFRVEGARKFYKLSNTDQYSLNNRRSLKLAISDLRRAGDIKLYYKPFYRREDFDDERYLPIFSPQVYSGQEIKIIYKSVLNSGRSMIVSPYVRLTNSRDRIIGKSNKIDNCDWSVIDWVIPDTNGEAVDEIGLIFENPFKETYIGDFYIDNIHIFGEGNHFINFTNEKEEFNSVTQFSYNRGKWSLEDGKLQGVGIEDAECYTGNYYIEDISLTTVLMPKNGFNHMIAFRVQGLLKGYYFGFSGENRVALIKNNNGIKETLAVCDYLWKLDKEYCFNVKAVGNNLSIKINDENILDFKDEKDCYEYGMYGFALFEQGRLHVVNLKVDELRKGGE
ncbi:MAG TPA: ADP-ribosylglycohydrolase family protein [Victivallales bacterium]|nr:ADP-ribosylglycohydrolase family protein [Victivallales bacterium]